MDEMDNVERGIGLLAIATIMIRHEISARQALKNKSERIKLMMANGMDGKRAEELLEIEINDLID